MKRILNKLLTLLPMHFIITLILIFCLAWYFLAPNNVKQQWQEEVLLSSGDSLWIEREAKFAVQTTGPLTLEKGRIKNMVVTIKVPENLIAPSPPIWRFNAVPILLDYDVKNMSWTIIATLFYCSSWIDAGHPSLATWQYIVKNNQWVVVPLDATYVGRYANLSTSFTDDRKKLKKITQQEIKKSSRADLYKVINGTRKPINCNF